MTENLNQPNNQDENLQPQGPACSTGKCCSGGFLRALVYTPAILCLGALAALATFPELADRIAPSNGGSCASSGARCMFSCPFSSPAKDTSETAKLMASGSCCSSQQSAGLVMKRGLGCCDIPETQEKATEPSASSDEPNSDLTSTTGEEVPADATNAANAVDSLTSDAPSN